ncbi:MAG: Eco57I restriction-modification methylase domain-containing protein [Eubacteriales bacterium]
MRIRRKNIFTTVRTEGSLLPPELLQRIAGSDRELGGLGPDDYHLGKGERLNEAINRSWNRLLGVWASFNAGLEKLPAGDPATTVTRERWLLVLFQELGYGRLLAAKAVEIEGKSYPVSHAWQHTAIHLVGCRVDLDHRTAGVAGAARTSPHSLVQELLNRSSECLWAFVSNGLTLRILRDNVSLTRQAYVEFDLQGMMDGEVYPDFALLWLLCHQSRIESERPEQCWLEKWSQAARDQGTRALDQLREGVEDAIAAFGRGFLAHPANRPLRQKLQAGELSTQDYYRQILRLVYRLIFLFAAEDRELLLDPKAPADARERYGRFYSTTRIRGLAERRRGTKHADLFRGLMVVMEKLDSDGGCPELGLPALGSFLWSRQALPDLAGCDIANRDLLDAMRALALSTDGHARRPVDYKNLGTEELGSIYESLLELHPTLDTGAGTFELTTSSGSERKTTGSYYTPSSLINCLLDSALDPVLEEAARQKEPESAILNLKVCDPACGSGHFLIAAAHRIAKRLAAIRTGDDEPAPEAQRTALRDVIGRCIYGVDINEMAVELCKVGLWMEALEPGKPLSFLDHRILCGNSLLGATPALLKKGIPDEAFKPIEGDDKKICAEFKKRNKQERETGQTSLFFDDAGAAWPELGKLSACMTRIDSINDSSIAGIYQKQEQYEQCVNSQGYIHSQILADAWCSAFFWKKTVEFPYPITEEVFRKIEQNPSGIPPWMIKEIHRLARQYQFFHWHLAFPDVFRVHVKGENPENEQAGWSGGFDVVLGNPPWERVKLQEKEWFAGRSPEIANAPNAAARRRMISALETEDPGLYKAFLEDRRKAEGESHFVRDTTRFPLCGRGDVNTYAIFAETMRLVLGQSGKVGCIVPSGIATDDTTKFFFQDIMDTQTLASLYDFENRKGLFPAVDSRMKFCLLTFSGAGRQAKAGAEFVFFAHHPEDLLEKERRFTLSAADLALLNPNTRTCPIFRSRRDAELTKEIYRRVPVLIKEGQPEENIWGIKFATMFHMANDSHLFRTRQQLEDEGWRLDGNVFRKDEEKYLPLYEAKMLYQFDHRFGSYEGADIEGGNTHLPTPEANQYRDPSYRVMPRYWVPEKNVLLQVSQVPGAVRMALLTGIEKSCCEALYFWIAGYRVNRNQEAHIPGELFKSMNQLSFDWLAVKKMENDYPLTEDDLKIILECSSCLEAAEKMIKRKLPGWLLGWRDITNATNERTVIASVLPLAGVGHKLPLCFFRGIEAKKICSLYANLNTLCFDYIARLKYGSTSLSYFYLKQFPVLDPSNYLKKCPWLQNIIMVDYITALILELTYTAWDLQPFAKDCGYKRPPFRWDEERRFLIRCELDAAYFHLYGIERDDLDYIMETFPIVKRKDEAAYGSYRTKEKILEIYEQMKQAIETSQPYQTMLDPPPGPPAVWPPQPGQPWPSHIHLPKELVPINEAKKP